MYSWEPTEKKTGGSNHPSTWVVLGRVDITQRVAVVVVLKRELEFPGDQVFKEVAGSRSGRDMKKQKRKETK